MKASGNGDEDECLGVGLFSTRAIQKGEQIYASYSGDDKISKVWETAFGRRCYCVQCSGTCCKKTSPEWVQGGSSTTPASLVKGDPMIATDQPPPDKMDTETASLGLGQTGEGRLLTSTDNILSVARHPSLKATAISGNAQQTASKRQWGSPASETSLVAPKARTSAILHQHYVSEVMQIFRQSRNFRAQIVDAFEISIRGRDV